MNKKQARIQVLEAQVARLQRRIDRLQPRSNRYSWIRVILFFGGLGLSLLLWIFVAWWLALPLALLSLLIFFVVAHYQGQIDRSIARHTLWLHIKSAHIARMQLDWEHIPEAYTPGPQENHPFEFDLDITGTRSIHRLLNTAISREGTLRLHDWLLSTTPDLAIIQQRQELVRELVPQTRFRDRLILNSLQAASRIKEELEGQRLLNWLQRQEASRSLRGLLWIATALNVLTVVLFVLAQLLPLPQLWIGSLVIALFFHLATGEQRGEIFDDANYLRYGFSTLSRIFSYLETYPYNQTPHLKALCRPFFADRSQGPSQLLKGVARISSAATLKNNGLLWLLVNALMPWDLYCAYRLKQYKQRIAQHLPTWLDSWFEVEALCSLAAFAYLNPEYTLPDVVACNDPARNGCELFTGMGLGHPLIAAEKKVTNDFSIQRLGDVVILTGSNMAGKSTFLRTLGINLCLAYAGAPVDARMLHVSLFRLFTCIRVTDSVTDGYSYFYAEVRRLHALLQALEESSKPPLFFLVDEIFKGTNNRERLIGSRSYVRALAGRRCVGAISTHDLELVTLADTLPQVSNAHFRETVVDGRLAFDYILRSGPCPTTNALKIMELEGLPIDG